MRRLAVLLVLLSGCSLTVDSREPAESVDLDRVALDLVWSEMTSMDRADVCASVDALGSEAAAVIILSEAPDFDRGTVETWLEETC